MKTYGFRSLEQLPFFASDGSFDPEKPTVLSVDIFFLDREENL
ncbi:MAG TPA: hypothetical protein VJH92_06005 [Candidatus Nanoarchaeia archaeon]|nr:hypothetical protein [Candidatus Nanoarchaeia archaeon]